MRTKRAISLGLAFAFVVFACGAAVAQTTTPPPAPPPPAPAPPFTPTTTVTATAAPSSDRGAFLVGLRVGPIVPFNGLSAYVAGGLELGYVLPMWRRSLAFTLGLEYTAPNRDGTQLDPRVAGTTYSWHLTEEMLTIMPTVLYRMTFLSRRFIPYVGLGLRIFLLKSTVRGRSGAAGISETTEQSSKVGVGLPLGLEIALGYGGITVELLLQHADIEHTATGGARNGAGTLYFGYRFLF